MLRTDERYFGFVTSVSFGFAGTGGAVPGHPVSSTNVAVSAAGPRWSSSNTFSTRAVCSSSLLEYSMAQGARNACGTLSYFGQVAFLTRGAVLQHVSDVS